MTVIKAKNEDVKDLALLEAKRFPSNGWTLSQWEYEISENQYAIVYLIKEEEKLIGYIDFWILYEQATIAKIAVDVNYENKGYGSFLLKKALEKIDEELCTSTTLEVRVHNQRAIHLYEKHGFKYLLKKNKYYQDGEDAFVYIRYIGGVNV